MNTAVYSTPFARAISRGRGIAVLAVVTVVGFFAQFPATQTMTDHGATILDFEFAGSAAKAAAIVSELGPAGRTGAWTQLAIDVPFLIGYGLLIAGCCLAAAEKLAKADYRRLASFAKTIAWCGPIAAVCDMTQNIALAFELEGHTGQPAPGISQVFGYLTLAFAGIGIATIAIGIAVLLLGPPRFVTTADPESE